MVDHRPVLGATAEFRRGWRVLFACFLGIGVGVSSLLFYTSGVFMLPLQEAFGWSRAQVSAQSIFGVAVLSVLSPFVGALIDRFGIRLIALISLLSFAAGMFAFSFMGGQLWVFYGITLVMALFACGSSPVTFTRAVTRWFDHARGLALGLALLGAGLAGALVPLILAGYVAEMGWRAGYQVTAGFIAISAVVVWLLIREAPEDRHSKAANTEGMLFRDVVSSRIFVILVLVFFLVACAVGGAIVHFIPMLQDAGLSPEAAGRYASIIGLSIMTGRVVTGVLIDRFFAPHIAAGMFAIASLGYLAFLLGGLPYALLAAIAVGFSMGAEVDLIGYLVSRYFGLKSYGTIYGTLYAVFLAGAGISPFLMGWAFDMMGDYSLALTVSIGLLVAAAALLLTLPAFTCVQKTPQSPDISKELT